MYMYMYMYVYMYMYMYMYHAKLDEVDQPRGEQKGTALRTG